VPTQGRRVVITAMGLISPCGNSVEESWKNIVEGRSGIGEVTAFDASEYSSRVVGEVKDFDPTRFMDKKEIRRTDRSAQLALAAASEAMSGFDDDNLDYQRFGTIIGSGIGGIITFEKQHKRLLDYGPSKISPFFIPMMIVDMASGKVSIKHGLKGPNFATVSACASGGHAISDSFMYVKDGYADIMITGGTEATICPMALGGFCSMKALSTRNDQPGKASRPFDIDRDGFVMSEGAGLVVLEELEHAKARGAEIYAEIVGVGLSADAYHITSPVPGGVGAVESMKMAVRDAGIDRNDIDYINAHGTSTRYNDRVEAEAINNLFGDVSEQPKISSTKSVTGHLLGAAAGLELIACVKAINEGVAPPTVNLENKDQDCNLNHVANQAEEMDIKYALTNSFGFGGHNVSMVLKRFE
jgi:3-oxoacyl-[acyl-carrier-protein] synthase II